MIEPVQQNGPTSINLRKTFNVGHQGQNNGPANHYATINGGDTGTNGASGKNNLNQSVVISSEKQNMMLKAGAKPGNTLNDSVVITNAGNSNMKEGNAQQRKSIQSIVNQAFTNEDGVVFAGANNDSQLSHQKQQQSPSNSTQMSMVNRTSNYMAKTNSISLQKGHLAKSPQPIKLAGNMAAELDMTRASPQQI